MIVSHDLGDIVEFDNRNYPVHEIPHRIADCNVGVVPLEISSITDYALPLKLLKYISMGLRCEAPHFCDEDCLFYDWDSVESLRCLLDRIAEEPQLLERYHRRAVVLRDKFSWRTEEQKYIALVKDLATKPRSRHANAVTTSELLGNGR